MQSQSRTQCKQILQHLEHGPITHRVAESRFNCTRLAARIYDLKKQGHRIEKRMVAGRRRGVWFAEYRLVNE